MIDDATTFLIDALVEEVCDAARNLHEIDEAWLRESLEAIVLQAQASNPRRSP